MTREQDFERQLADWLADGPNTAPAEVVDRALEQTAVRRQRRGIGRWLVLPLERVGHWFPTHRTARVSALAAVLAGILLTSVVVSVPFLGGSAGPAPEMDDAAVVAIEGSVNVDITSETPTQQTRVVDIESEDQRIDGRARQDLIVLAQSANTRVLRGTMRLENDWGTWEGEVDIVTYPSGEEYEYAALEGTRAYEGFTYHYAIYDQPAGTVRTLEGAIWPDEPPAMPEPSLLP